MIAYIDGTLTETDESGIVLDCGGIGYYLLMSGRDLANMRVGEEYRIYSHLNVREDAMTLFGFLSRQDREIFRMLINVSGIGPKGAIGILSALSADELRYAVLADDSRTISRAPGIGAKTARKLILELKDKFSLDDLVSADPGNVKTAGSAGVTDAQNDAVQALTALGYSASDALHAVRKVEGAGQMTTEQILKQALKYISV